MSSSYLWSSEHFNLGTSSAAILTCQCWFVYRYHIPRSWVQASNNLLVIFEETEKNPFEISIKSHLTETICAKVSEDYFPPLHAWSLPDTRNGTILLNNVAPEIYLHCDAGNIISSIKFASYGTPQGSCQNFSRSNCHAPNSHSVLSQVCMTIIFAACLNFPTPCFILCHLANWFHNSLHLSCCGSNLKTPRMHFQEFLRFLSSSACLGDGLSLLFKEKLAI